jgi:xanthine dehydrogenase molybdopterin-binding subunit B
MPTSTDKVPNTSATAASCGTDLNGMAVKNACDILRERLVLVALNLLKARWGERPREPFAAAQSGSPGVSPHQPDVIFADNFVYHRAAPDLKVPFAEVVQAAYFQRIGLSSTGYYRTPEIHYDRAKGKGKPFHYFAVGAAVTEVEVDGFTGMHRTLRADILQDAGNSINPGINVGQIEGAYVQGAGWLTCEELVWNDKGVLLTHSPDTYKIPAIGDRPLEFKVKLLENATQANTIFGSKAVGEPPFMLAISVREAIRDAVAAFGEGKGEVTLASPATCEAIWRAVQNAKAPNSKLQHPEKH